MKVLTVVGARPQFIKCAPVSKEIRKVGTEILVHTGQHYDEGMSDVFFRDLDLPKPDHNLGVGSGSPSQETGQMLEKLEGIMLEEKPHCMLVYGDTNSTIAGALAAVKLHIPVVHVEAGLRSFNREMPEEINRVVTDHVSNLLLCPTQTGVENLKREGIIKGVYLIGDVMYDALWDNWTLANDRSSVLFRLQLTTKQFALATVHRAENTDNSDNLRGILKALTELGRENEKIVFPVHPRTKKRLHELGWSPPDQVLVVDPVSYLDMLSLEANASIILSDSGGVQKEAYWLGVPCITLRNETEWVETVESGWNVLAGTESKTIVELFKSRKKKKVSTYNGWSWRKGEASERVAGLLAEKRWT